MSERMNVWAGHIHEALQVRDDLYHANDTDPHHWDRAATMLDNVGFEHSAQLCRDWADGLRYEAEKETSSKGEEGRAIVEVLIIIFLIVLCIVVLGLAGWPW